MKVIWLNNDRSFSLTNFRSSHQTEIQYKRALYIMQPEAVKLREEAGEFKNAEIFYFQSNALPIQANQGEPITNTNDYLDRFVLINALKQTGDPRLSDQKARGFLSWPELTVSNILKWAIFGLIGYALLRGFIIG